MPVNAKGKPCGHGSPGVKVAGRKFALYKPPKAIELPELSEQTLWLLFEMALATNPQGVKPDRGRAVMKQFASLVRAEYNYWLASRA